MHNRLCFIALGLLASTVSCKGDDNGNAMPLDASAIEVGALPDGVAPTNAQDVLASAGACALQLQRSFASLTVAHKSAIDLWKSAAADGLKRMAAQETWRQAMATWQQLEVFQFGPAAVTKRPGGQDLRDRIYSWPATRRCGVETALVRQHYANPAILDALFYLRGLDALETLLFVEGKDHGCPATDTQFTSEWAAIDATVLNQRRADYAAVLANTLVAEASALVAAWAPESGNFLAQLQDPRGGVFGSQQMALNAVSDATFYVARETKDMKLAVAMGLNTCASCSSSFESPMAKTTKSNIRANLEGFSKLLRGCGTNGEGAGFEDLMWSRGLGTTAAAMTTQLAAAIAAFDALASPTLETAIAAERPQVDIAYNHIVNLSRLLKSDFVTQLNLNIPMDLEGDND